ncbi:hypothetical protein V6Z11_A04G138200 [Gossypium hirsutum]
MPKPSIALKVRLRPTKQSPPTVRARRAMSPSPSLLSFSSCCGSEWKGTIDHVSNVARWMSARRGRARDVRCLGTASIAAAEGWLLGFCRKFFFWGGLKIWARVQVF